MTDHLSFRERLRARYDEPLQLWMTHWPKTLEEMLRLTCAGKRSLRRTRHFQDPDYPLRPMAIRMEMSDSTWRPLLNLRYDGGWVDGKTLVQGWCHLPFAGAIQTPKYRTGEVGIAVWEPWALGLVDFLKDRGWKAVDEPSFQIGRKPYPPATLLYPPTVVCGDCPKFFECNFARV